MVQGQQGIDVLQEEFLSLWETMSVTCYTSIRAATAHGIRVGDGRHGVCGNSSAGT